MCIDAIQLITYDFLLICHCNCVTILHRFTDIISYLQIFKEIT